MKVGWHAPPPPARSGVADHAAALAGHLARLGRIEAEAPDADVAVYHLGNNQLHRDIYRRALERPGVAVLHDAVLQHFFLGSLAEEAYVEEFVFNYGEWFRGLARDMWRRRAGSGASARYFDFPMLKRVADRSRAVVVHNPAAARAVREHAPGAQVVEIPLLYDDARPTADEAARLRLRLGILPDVCVFGVFGYLRESKRVMTVLRAFAEARQREPRCALLLGGDFVSSDLERAAAPLLRHEGVVRLPYLDRTGFQAALASADCAINLRYPTAGETSAITVRAMGAGIPVMLTAAEENEPYPEGACLRVDPGPAERAELCEYMILAVRQPALRREMGRRAAEYIVAHHAPERVAGLYWKVLCESCS